jgi:hypothetical protein
MALICLRCASANCTCGWIATAIAHARQSDVIAEPIEGGNPVLLSSGHVIAVADDPSAEQEARFVLKPRND